MKYLLLFIKLMLCLSLLSLTACPSLKKNPVILQINSQKWTSQQFAKLLAQKLKPLNLKDIPDELFLEKIKSQLIEELLLKNLVQEWAKTQAIFVSKKELDQALIKIKKAYPSDEVFALYLKRKKTNLKEWQKNISERLLHKKVIQKISSKAQTPTEKEMREYYKNNLNLFKKNSSRLIHHLFHKKKAPLLKIKQALIKPEEAFIDTAKKFLKQSEITEAKWVEKGTLAVFDKSWTLKKREISPLWQSPYGYHIIQVLDKKPQKILAFLAVKEEIKKTLFALKRKAFFAKWLDKESQKATVFKNESAIKNIKVKKL